MSTTVFILFLCLMAIAMMVTTTILIAIKTRKIEKLKRLQQEQEERAYEEKLQMILKCRGK